MARVKTNHIEKDGISGELLGRHFAIERVVGLCEGK